MVPWNNLVLSEFPKNSSEQTNIFSRLIFRMQSFFYKVDELPFVIRKLLTLYTTLNIINTNHIDDLYHITCQTQNTIMAPLEVTLAQTSKKLPKTEQTAFKCKPHNDLIPIKINYNSNH